MPLIISMEFCWLNRLNATILTIVSRPRSYSRRTTQAAVLLGQQIRIGRRERGWTAAELARRVGVAETTLRKVERGDPSVSLGAAFEAAALVGVSLFAPDEAGLARRLREAQDRLTLLPARVRRRAAPDDDF
jgi:transcriptional regulator with XRE-family HTH domain